MARISEAARERGRAAEAAFKRWLDRSSMGYMVVDQTPFTVPPAAGHIKRPDYLVGILSVGLIAIDVKGRSLVDDHLLIDLDEFQGFVGFERYFGTSVWYGCYPDETGRDCLLFRNADLAALQPTHFNRRNVIRVPRELMTPARPREESFDLALFSATRARPK